MSKWAGKWANEREKKLTSGQISKVAGKLAKEWKNEQMIMQMAEWAGKCVNEWVNEQISWQMSKQRANEQASEWMSITHTTTTKLMIFSQHQLPLMVMVVLAQIFAISSSVVYIDTCIDHLCLSVQPLDPSATHLNSFRIHLDRYRDQSNHLFGPTDE